MTLENVYYIGQTVAVMAILASLVFVGMQVRQSNRAAEQANKLAKADMTLASWSSAIAMQGEIFSTPESADLMQRALFGAAPLTDADKLRFGINMSNMLSAVESGDVLWRQGLFDEKAYHRTLRSMAIYFQSPRVRKWWKLARQDRFIPPFSGVIDEIAQKAEAKSRLVERENPQEPST